MEEMDPADKKRHQDKHEVNMKAFEEEATKIILQHIFKKQSFLITLMILKKPEKIMKRLSILKRHLLMHFIT